MAPVKNKNYYEELNIFRGLVMIWVVFGHSFTSDGSLGFLNEYAYSFHMQAFFALSGILFFSKINRINSVRDALNAIADRAKRLLVPYFVYTAITYLLKLVLERYAYHQLSENIFSDVLLGINNPNGGLWFLHTLFVISLLAVILCKVPLWISFVVSLGLNIFCSFVPFFVPVVSNICEYSVFFFGGLLLYRYYGKIRSIFISIKNSKNSTAKITFIAVAAVACSLLVFGLLMKTEFYGKVKILVSSCGIIAWYLASYAVMSFKATRKFTSLIGDYGMDIYMLAYFVQVPIRVVFSTILGVPYDLCAIFMLILGLIVPIPVSKYIIRKVSVFRALFLGDFKKKNIAAKQQ